MSLVLDGTEGLTYNDGTLQTSAPVGKNRIINGAMSVAQRSTSETGLGAASGYFTLDRWNMYAAATAGRFTMAQVADGPPGFANCLKLTTTTADTSIAAGEYLILAQNIEGQDVQQLKKGTASAEQVTISFWVKGNATALYVCELQDLDNSRLNTQSFAVTTSWNRIELTFAADTTGALDDDNAASLGVNFWLHAGSNYTGGTFASNTWAARTDTNRAAVDGFTSIFDATSRTFFITGVQMEIGATATEFESRTFGEELALCQRYARPLAANDCIGQAISATAAYFFSTGITMRAVPTLSTSSGAVAVTAVGGTTAITTLLVNSGGATNGTVLLNTTTTSGLVAGDATFLAGAARLLVAEL